MIKNKDQILLENIYSNMSQSSNLNTLPTEEEGSDYDKAEKMLSMAFDRYNVYEDPSSEKYNQSLKELVAAIQHSPEDAEETAEKIALSFLEPESQNQNEYIDQNNLDAIDLDSNEISNIPEQQYESNTILNAYKKVIAEGSRKKNNEYAICTASVGRKNEAKYKRCKRKVKQQINK